MKIPSCVKIGGIPYEVEWDATLGGERRAFGELHAATQKIVLDGQMPAEQAGETLLHEIIEAITVHNDLTLDHQHISTLAFQLYQVIRDNNLVF